MGTTGGLEHKPGATTLVQRSSGGAAVGTPGKQTLTEQLGVQPATYTVQAGENLVAIAAKLHTTVEALRAANADQLRSFPAKHGTVQGFNAGDVIIVPPGTGPAVATASTAAPTTPAATAPTAGHGDEPAAVAPLAELSDAQRGAALSTFLPGELGENDKFGMSKTGRDGAKQRGSWLSADAIKKAGRGKSGQAYVDSVDALVDHTQLGTDQHEILAAAKDFAAAPKALTAPQAQRATIDWGKAQLTLDGVSLNGDLKARLVAYVRFLAWAGLVSGPTTIGSVMRSPQSAHKLSVAWMFNLRANTAGGSTLHKADNRKKLVNSVAASGGGDADGNTWLGASTVAGLVARKDDDAALYAYIKSTAAPEANQVQKQPAIAAEGYTTSAKRHPNVLGGASVSNHLLGEAVDMYPPFVFNNKFDPMIDAIAMYFGLWRAVKDNASSPEHWHYERLGMPPGAEHAEH